MTANISGIDEDSDKI